jgi:hypothetical protein
MALIEKEFKDNILDTSLETRDFKIQLRAIQIYQNKREPNSLHFNQLDSKEINRLKSRAMYEMSIDTLNEKLGSKWKNFITDNFSKNHAKQIVASLYYIIKDGNSEDMSLVSQFLTNSKKNNNIEEVVGFLAPNKTLFDRKNYFKEYRSNSFVDFKNEILHTVSNSAKIISLAVSSSLGNKLSNQNVLKNNQIFNWIKEGYNKLITTPPVLYNVEHNLIIMPLGKNQKSKIQNNKILTPEVAQSLAYDSLKEVCQSYKNFSKQTKSQLIQQNICELREFVDVYLANKQSHPNASSSFLENKSLEIMQKNTTFLSNSHFTPENKVANTIEYSSNIVKKTSTTGTILSKIKNLRWKAEGKVDINNPIKNSPKFNINN